MTGNPGDEGIRALWARMADGSAADFAAVFAEDVAFISTRGTSEPGRAGVRARHAALFAGPLRGTALDVHLELVRHLRDGVALVHASTRVLGPDTTLVLRTHAQAVLVREHDSWLIVAFHNMIGARP